MAPSGDPELMARFAARRLRQNVVSAVVLVCALLLYTGSAPALLAPAALLIFGCVLFSFWNWRCPGCSRYLGSNGVREGRCGHCQIVLSERPGWWERRWILGPLFALAAGIAAFALYRLRVPPAP